MSIAPIEDVLPRYGTEWTPPRLVGELRENQRATGYSFPSKDDFETGVTLRNWESDIGHWISIMWSSDGLCNTQEEYCRLVSGYFSIIFKVSTYNSEYNRRRSSGEKHTSLAKMRPETYDNSYSAELHQYNTRSHYKYTGDIQIELFNLERGCFSNIINTLSIIFPDLDIYFRRTTPIMNSVNIKMPHIEDYTNRSEGILFEGGLMPITQIIVTGRIYDLMNQIFDAMDNQEEDLEDLEDVSIHLTRRQYTDWIGTRKATKKHAEADCAICCETVKRGQTISATTCGHLYHSSCLRTWLTKQCTLPTCPTCRADLRK
jgi:hypothetical protein